jgi:putative transposase
MCRVLDVSASGYYGWKGRAPSRHAIDDAVLTERIRLLHAASDEIYGSPNIHAKLRDKGTRVGRKRLARLMRTAGLRGVSRRRGFVVTTQRERKLLPAHDLVNRAFTADGPNQLWVTDITYIPTLPGSSIWQSWSMSGAAHRRLVVRRDDDERSLVLAVLNLALKSRKRGAVIHNRD